MTQDQFKTQMERLKANWPSFYTDARVGVLWDAFHRVDERAFGDAVTGALGSLRSAPLKDELAELVTAAQRRITVAGGAKPAWAWCIYCGAEGLITMELASGGRAPGACDHCESGRDRKEHGFPSVYQLMDMGYRIELTISGKPRSLRNGQPRAEYPARQKRERTWGTRSQEGGPDE